MDEEVYTCTTHEPQTPRQPSANASCYKNLSLAVQLFGCLAVITRPPFAPTLLQSSPVATPLSAPTLLQSSPMRTPLSDPMTPRQTRPPEKP